MTDQTALVGSWQLLSFALEDPGTGECRKVLVKAPKGWLVLTSDCRLVSVLTAEEQPSPRTDEDHRRAFHSMLAYAGRYHLDGTRLVTEVDVAWDWSCSAPVRSAAGISSATA